MIIDKSKKTNEQKQSILIFRIGHLGDTLVAMPAIFAIRKLYPDHNLVLLTERHDTYISSWDILGPTGWFDDVLYYDPSHRPIVKIKNMTMLMAKLRKLAPEYIFDLSPERTLSQHRRDRFFFTRIAKIKNYVGRRTDITKEKRDSGRMSVVEPEWKRLLSIVSGEESLGYRLHVPENERLRAQKILQALNIAPRSPLFAICPGSKMPAKRWPKERFAKLGRFLQEEYPGSNLVILGGNEDQALGNELCSKWGKRCHNLAGKLSIYGSAAVLENCNAYVGNDTGTMHLAAMVGTPCVAIFSARDCPGKWEPYGTNNIILRHEIECAGCMLENCVAHQMACLKHISVDRVFSSVVKVISN